MNAELPAPNQLPINTTQTHLALTIRLTRGFVSLALAATFTAHATDAATLNGVFRGTGRACYGTLNLSQKQLVWNTPFSKCSTRAFQATELEVQDGRKRSLYELRGVSKKCLYRTLVLHHPDPQQPDAGWDLTAYRTHADYKINSTENYMSCALVRTK